MLNASRFPNRSPDNVKRTRVIKKGLWTASHTAFRWKYTVFLIAAVFGTMILFLGVASNSMYQNYEIFKKLAFETNPELVGHLEREITWFGIFLVATASAVFLFCLGIGLRMTSNIIKPFIHLEQHMKKVIQGDWSNLEFRYRGDEDFSELLDTYSYLYKSLRAHTEHEIKMLEKLSIDPTNREALSIWKTLIFQKRKQLNLITTIKSEADAKTLQVRESRRAS